MDLAVHEPAASQSGRVEAQTALSRAAQAPRLSPGIPPSLMRLRGALPVGFTGGSAAGSRDAA